MKPKRLAFIATIALSISSAHAADRWWDGTTPVDPGNGTSAGGSGTWNTTDALGWDQGAGLNHVAWNNAGYDTATFATTGGTVTMGENITAAALISTPSNTIKGDFTLTLATAATPTGATPALNVTANTTTIGNGTPSNATILAGTEGLAKTGTGTLTLNGAAAHTLTGGLKVLGGTMNVDFANLSGSTPFENLIASGNAVTLGRATLDFKARTTAATTTNQTVNGLTIDGAPGALKFTSASNAGTLTLGNITRLNDAILNITLPVSASALIATSKTNNTAGILGTWCTVNSAANTRYAYKDGTKIAAFVPDVAQQIALSSGLTDTTGLLDYDLSVGGTAPDDTASIDFVANTIRYTGTTGTTKPSVANPTDLFSVNGLMNVGSGVWTIGSGTTVATAGYVTIGDDQELSIIAANNGITINSSIEDNLAGASKVTISGGSTVTLGKLSTYTGTTTIYGANGTTDTVYVESLANAGTASGFGMGTNLVLNGATIRLNTAGISDPTSDRTITLIGNCGLLVKNSRNQIITGSITGTGNLSIDQDPTSSSSAKLTLAGDNTFTGDALFQTDGRVILNHANALKNATLNLSGQRISIDLHTNNHAYNIGGLKGNNLKVNLGTAGGFGGKVSIGSNNQSNTYTGELTGAAGLIKKGTGTQILVKCSYAGDTVIETGTLKLGTASSLTYSAATVGQDNSYTPGKSYLTVTSTAGLAVGQAITDSAMPAGTTIAGIDGATRVILSNTVTSGSTYAGTIEAMNGSIASPVIEVKSVATLDTTALTSAFPVSASQALGGAGTVTGPISVSGDISPGVGSADLAATTGTLTTGNVTFGATGEYVCTVNGANCDVLAAGSLTVNPAAKVTISGTPTAAPYVIATYTGAAPTHFDESGLPAGYSLDYTEAGKIKLVEDVGGGTPFENWASGAPYNLSGDAALPGSDPDGDGVENIVEFALGGDPTDGSNSGPSLAKVQNAPVTPALTLTIAIRTGTTFGVGTGAPLTSDTVDGINYTIEGSQNLLDWTSTEITRITPALTDGMDPAPSGYEYHTFKTAGPISSTVKDFIRVQVIGQ